MLGDESEKTPKIPPVFGNIPSQGLFFLGTIYGPTAIC